MQLKRRIQRPRRPARHIRITGTTAKGRTKTRYTELLQNHRIGGTSPAGMSLPPNADIHHVSAETPRLVNIVSYDNFRKHKKHRQRWARLRRLMRLLRPWRKKTQR